MQLLILKHDSGSHKKGDIVEVRATGSPFGGEEPDHYVMVEVPDLPMTEYEHANGPWERIIDYSIVGHDPAIDGYRIRMFSATANAGQAEIAKAEVEGFITAWNGTVHSWGTNEVVFDLIVYDALVSPALWEIDVSDVVFTELSYDQGTGIHRVQADYGLLGNNPTYVERYVRRMGLDIISHAGKVLVYEADHNDVARRILEADIAEKCRKRIQRRRYYVTSAVVDYIVGQGGVVTTDKATLDNYIKDKAVD